MTDRPIIFSAPMVRALLDGRKTQTRRILKPASVTAAWPGVMWPSYVNGQRIGDSSADPEITKLPAADGGTLDAGPTPYVAGDRLYVREAHAIVPASAYRMSEGVEQAINPADRDEAVVYRTGWERSAPRWRPSIHMPRWASRLTLIVSDVRLQRLQEISEDDAIAEGVDYETADPPFWYVPGIWPHSLTAVGIEEPGGRHAERSFAKLWNSINGPGAWDANPWVVALTFFVHRQNIDAMKEAA